MKTDFDLHKFCVVLTSHGYGSRSGHIENILMKVTKEEVRELMYVCQRAAEKLGEEAFWCGYHDKNYEQEQFQYLFTTGDADEF